MTEQEAINRIINHRDIHRLKEQRAFYITEAFDMAIEALEKQIPKDVIFVHPLQKDDDGDYMCPSCETGTVYNAYGKKSLYCPYCGQALKWK